MEEQKNRRKGVTAIVALVAGVALLAGGSTYALWSASDDIKGGTITAGDLDLKADKAYSFDVSADRADGDATVLNRAELPLRFAEDQAGEVINLKAVDDQLTGHAIEELATWLMVPGDTVAVLIPYTVTLKGDNLVAELTIDSTEMVAEQKNTDMVYHYAVFDANGQQIGQTNPIESAVSLPVALFQANQAGQGHGVPDQYTDSNGNTVEVPVIDIDDEMDGTAHITLVVFGHFTDTGETQGRKNVTAADALGTVTATLTQVRSGTDNFVTGS